jgi:hypothetical protein
VDRPIERLKMSDLMLFWWIAAFLVISPIPSRFLDQALARRRSGRVGLAMSGYIVFTLYLNGVPASDRAALLMVAVWTLLAPVIAWLIMHSPSVS